MTYVLCSVYDEIADFYSPPFHAKTTSEAQRIFNDACNSGNSQLSQHPQDFKLYRIGSYDDSKGLLVPVEPQFLIRGSHAINPDE